MQCRWRRGSGQHFVGYNGQMRPSSTPARSTTTGSKWPLRSRSFVLLLISAFAATSNYATLLSVVPLWAAEGGSGGTGVGSTTAVMMAATVASQLSMPSMLRLLPLRSALALGAALMGVATPAYLISNALGPVLAVSAVRGLGFGMVVVAGSALTAELVPSRLIGKGIGVYGLATGLPSAICLPAGVWIAQEVGFAPVFLVITALTFAAVPIVLGVGSHESRHEVPLSGVPAGRSASGLGLLIAPTLLMVGVSIAFGGLSTFVPLAIEHPLTASTALFAMSIGVNVGRFGAGAVSDVIGAGRVALPAVLVGVLGLAGLAWLTGSEHGVIVSVTAFAFGISFGGVQTDTLVVMFRRAGKGGRRKASTVWNMAFDGGAGMGAVALGGVVALASYEVAFAVSAGLVAATVPVAWRERKWRRGWRRGESNP